MNYRNVFRHYDVNFLSGILKVVIEDVLKAICGKLRIYSTFYIEFVFPRAISIIAFAPWFLIHTVNNNSQAK